MNLFLRRMLVLGLPSGLVLLGASAGTTSCTGPDPSAIVCKDRLTGEERRCNDAGHAVSSSSSSSTSSTSSSSSSSSSGDSGLNPNDNPFREPTFAGTALTPAAQTSHTARNVSTLVNRNAACLSCHRAGANAPAFIAGGMVFKTSSASEGAPNVEVWLWNAAANQSAKVNSDANGAFWFPAATTTVGAPFKMGVRDDKGVTKIMKDINTGDCNSSTCHGQSTPGVYVQ